MSEELTILNLEPGKTYEVEVADCCVNATFTDTFYGYAVDEDGDPIIAIFNNARVDNLWHEYEVVERSADD